MYLGGTSALCIDFGGTDVKIGIVDGEGRMETGRIPVPASQGRLPDVEAAVARIRTAAGYDGPFQGVGMALPGVVDRGKGALTSAHGKYSWALGMDLRSWAEQTFGAPAVVENDARAALLGETNCGVARGSRDVVMMTLGTGIGTAAMMGGALIRGRHDHAGVLGGHFTLELAGQTCNCGNIGCAETLASAWALGELLRRHPMIGSSEAWQRRLSNGPVGVHDVFSCVGNSPQDDIAEDVAAGMIRAWGATAVNLTHAYDPDILVVSGGVMGSAGVILPRLRAYVDAHLWPSQPRPQILTPTGPEHSVLRGLAVLAGSAQRKDSQ